ncbi:MAG: glycosyltransferase family 4 protein [Patescibacteria group bacterium]
MSKKKVLIFSTAYYPFVGGAEVAVREICARIPDFEFVMITAKLDASLPAIERIGNIEVHRLGRGDCRDKYRLIASGARYAGTLGKFDAVWSIMASYAGFAAVRYKKNNPKVPFLLTLQEGDSRFDIYKHVWWCWPYFKQIFKKADKIQTISNYLATWAKEVDASCPIEVIPNGVDLEKFRKAVIPAKAGIQKQVSDIKQSLGINDGSKIVVTVSRLVKKNGVEDLIRAMEFLRSDVHLLIAGDGILKKKLLGLVDRLKLSDRVHFLGEISHHDLPEYFFMSDVFCRPSKSEGLGNVFLEAMAAGVPIIGTKVGGIPDFLTDNQTGLFCSVRDPRDISEKINRLMVDNSLRLRLAENGKKLTEAKFSWDLIAEKMKKIIGALYLSS